VLPVAGHPGTGIEQEQICITSPLKKVESPPPRKSNLTPNAVSPVSQLVQLIPSPQFVKKVTLYVLHSQTDVSVVGVNVGVLVLVNVGVLVLVNVGVLVEVTVGVGVLVNVGGT